MHSIVTGLIHFHGRIFLNSCLRVMHGMDGIVGLMMFKVIEFLILSLRLHGHHRFGTISWVHLRRWLHWIMRMIYGSAWRNRWHWTSIVELWWWMMEGHGWIMRRIHVRRYHIAAWRWHVHVLIVKLLRHLRRRWLVKVSLRGRSIILWIYWSW